MLVVVLLALGRAFVAGAGASSSVSRRDLVVAAGLPQREFAVASQISAQSRHKVMHWTMSSLGESRRRRSCGTSSRNTSMMDGIAERLVDVPVDVGMKGDHLADGHCVLPRVGSLP